MFISEAFSSSAALQSLTGGMLIGTLAAVRVYCTTGLLTCATPVLWLTTGTALFSLGLGQFYPTDIFEAVPDSVSWTRVVASGVLVGLGAKLGQGCTSGNGIQGLSALSPASLVHMLTFMGAGVAAGCLLGGSDTLPSTPAAQAPIVPLVAVALAGIACQFLRKSSSSNQKPPSQAVVAVTDIGAGFSFAASLIVAQMVHRSKVLGFLDLTNDQRGWDPSLMFVMGGALLVCFPAYQALGLLQQSHPAVQAWAARPVDAKHVLGGILFGAGWGLGGWCPGPAMVACGALSLKAVGFTAAMFGSRFAYEGATAPPKATKAQ